MNGTDLYRAVGAVDDDILLRSETAGKKTTVLSRWAALAACLCLCAAVLMTGGLSAPEGEGGDTEVDGPETVFTPVYNAATASETDEDSASCWYIPASFTRALTEEELDMGTLAPGKLVGYMRLSGEASFDGEGTLTAVTLRIATTLPENEVTLTITPEGAGESRFPEGGEVSPCNGVDYRVYEYDNGKGVTLAAEAEISGCGFFFTLETAKGDLAQAKRDFAEILECFTCYDAGQPDLSAITAGELPWWMDETLTLSEARQDGRFGAYLPAEAPRGFAVESVRRWRDPSGEGISALWTRNYDELSWSVRDFSSDDEQRLVSAGETEKYDLSRYPIPRAESVPEELREVVDDPVFDGSELTEEMVWARAYRVEDSGDGDGWRMAFSVRYGDTVVTVRSKGVEPDWVYRQLMTLAAR